MCFLLGNFTFLQVSVQINIQEGGNSSDRHGRAVLRLDRCQIAEVEPLDSLSCIPRRSRDVIPVGFRHLLHSLKCPDLLGNFLSLTDHIIGHGSVSAVVEILPFLFYQEINSVQSDPAVVADNSSSAVSIRKSGYDMRMPCPFHFRGVGVKHCLIMSLMIFIEYLMELVIDMKAVVFRGLFRHLNSAVWHKSSFQRLVRLKSHDFFQFLVLRINVSGSVGSQTGNHLGLAFQDASSCTLLLLKFLNFIPQPLRCLRRTFQKAFITAVRRIIVLNKIPNIDILCPFGSLESSPFFSHTRLPSLCLLQLSSTGYRLCRRPLPFPPEGAAR